MPETTWHLPEANFDYPLKLFMSGISHPDPAYHMRRTSGSEYYVIEYIVSGKGQLNIDNHNFYPKAGDVYLLEPYHRHEYYSSRSCPWEKSGSTSAVNCWII